MLKLPIPIFHNDSIYREVKIESPRSGVLADTHTENERSGYYSACHVFLAGSITKIVSDTGVEITDKGSIKQISEYLPLRSAEYLTDEIAVLLEESNNVLEGLYTCPMNGCNKQIICTEDYETADYLENIPVHVYKGNENGFEFELSKPVTILNADTKEVLTEVKSLKMEFQTLRHFIIAEREYGRTNQIELKFGVYLKSITHVNGAPVEKKWKSFFGMQFFRNIKDNKDLIALAEKIKSLGTRNIHGQKVH